MAQINATITQSGITPAKSNNTGRSPASVDPENQLTQITNEIKKKVAQRMAQQICDQICHEDTLGEQIEEEEGKQKEKGCFANTCAPLTLEYYQPYFDDLTNKMVMNKILSAFFPFKAMFIKIDDGKPDMYGPFWIYVTLVFVLAASGNFSTYLAVSNGKFQYNFDYVPKASTLVFSLGIIIPIIMTLIFKTFGSECSYSQNICIYGYASACLIPVTFGCSYPNLILQWGFMIYGAANSTLFLITNLFELLQSLQTKRYILVWFIAGSQIFILLVYKIYFFDSNFAGNNSSSSNNHHNSLIMHHNYKHIGNQI